MAVEIQKAEAFIIEPGKSYIVAFESDIEISMAEADGIKKQIIKIFKDTGATVKPIISIKGRLKITEVKE
jgi:hypothetical protein